MDQYGNSGSCEHEPISLSLSFAVVALVGMRLGAGAVGGMRLGAGDLVGNGKWLAGGMCLSYSLYCYSDNNLQIYPLIISLMMRVVGVVAMLFSYKLWDMGIW